MRVIGSLLRLSAILAAMSGTMAYAGVISSDPEHFDYLSLPASGVLEARITESSPRFEFKSGLSPYIALRLPQARGRYLVDIISLLEPPNDPQKSRVFYPSLALLSEHFLVIRASEGQSWRFDLPEYAQTVAPGYRVTVELDEEGAERYLIVYTEFGSGPQALPGASELGRFLIRVTPRTDL